MRRIPKQEQVVLNEKRIEADVLVIGAGGAGCFAAMRAQDKGAKVVVVNKVPWLGGCTMIARAGYSAAVGTSSPQDNPDIHFHDSVRGGDYMGNQKVLKTMCRENVEATLELFRKGAAFRQGPDGRIDQGSKKSAGHSYPRLIRVEGEFSHIGKVIMDILQEEMKNRNIEVVSNVMITNLLTSQGAIAGAVGFNWRDGAFMVFQAKTVVMATGGTGQLYKYTDNPTYMTGDGYAAMARAGGEFVDMEFCDFQLGTYSPPEMFGYPPNCGVWMAQGAMLLNNKGERFFKKYFPHRADEGKGLRTEVSKACAFEILDGNGSPNGMVYMNCSNVPQDWMATARADIVSHYKRAGVDLTWQPMEIAPGNHTWLGGLRIDEHAESTVIQGLYAGGEAAGGWGGSNRLGGNALAAAFGLGAAAGKSAGEKSRDLPMPVINEKQVKAAKKEIQELLDRREGVRASTVKKQVQELMQKNVWFRRNEKGLQSTLKEFEKLEKTVLPKLCVPNGIESKRYLLLREAFEAMNLVQCGQIVATAALNRKESRGSHQRTDYPEVDNKNWLKNVIVWQERGKTKARTEPVVVTEVPLPEV
jgi:fumarate reductase (CoM/CoB) subunit A